MWWKESRKSQHIRKSKNTYFFSLLSGMFRMIKSSTTDKLLSSSTPLNCFAIAVLLVSCSESSLLTITVPSRVPHTICFQLPHWVKTGGCMLEIAARTLWSSAEKLWGENIKKGKTRWETDQQFGERPSVAEYAAAAFSAWLPETHFYSIFNLTATGSVTAVLLRVILFLNCCRLPYNPAWNSQRRKPSVNISITSMTSLRNKTQHSSLWVSHRVTGNS